MNMMGNKKHTQYMYSILNGVKWLNLVRINVAEVKTIELEFVD